MVKLTVNGRIYEIDVEPNWTLWKVLREKLGITSVKSMCEGQGACGSCTVILDGRPVLSCLTLAVDCEGKKIETLEGIVALGHPIVEAYISNPTFQCGYCTPGFVITAKALLDKNPNPDVKEIIEALSGNICRCGTYPAHINAVLEAARKLGGEVW
jgi:aerobic-type carbon monoxide dehydrogenase small subunit (CoxS/CutS family)